MIDGPFLDCRVLEAVQGASNISTVSAPRRTLHLVPGTFGYELHVRKIPVPYNLYAVQNSD